jgi:hypothetical protein
MNVLKVAYSTLFRALTTLGGSTSILSSTHSNRHSTNEFQIPIIICKMLKTKFSIGMQSIKGSAVHPFIFCGASVRVLLATLLQIS